MQRAWQIHQLNVDFQIRTATVTMSDGATSVNAHFRFDAPGDAKESAVRAAALREAKKIWGEAAQANVS